MRSAVDLVKAAKSVLGKTDSAEADAPVAQTEVGGEAVVITGVIAASKKKTAPASAVPPLSKRRFPQPVTLERRLPWLSLSESTRPPCRSEDRWGDCRVKSMSVFC